MEQAPETAEQEVLTEVVAGYRQLQLNTLQAKVLKLRNMLYVVAAVIIIMNLVRWFIAKPDPIDFWFNISIGFIYIALAFFSHRFPFASILSALILFYAYMGIGHHWRRARLPV